MPRRSHIPVTKVISRTVIRNSHELTSWRKAADELSRVLRSLECIYLAGYNLDFGTNAGCNRVRSTIAETIPHTVLVILD